MFSFEFSLPSTVNTYQLLFSLRKILCFFFSILTSLILLKLNFFSWIFTSLNCLNFLYSYLYLLYNYVHLLVRLFFITIIPLSTSKYPFPWIISLQISYYLFLSSYFYIIILYFYESCFYFTKSNYNLNIFPKSLIFPISQ